MKPRHAYSLLLSTLIALAVTLTLYALSTHLMHKEMVHQSQSVIKLLDHLNRDVQVSWQKLSNNTHAACSEPHLSAMRAELFLTWHIKDIAYMQGDTVLCSVMAGKLKNPFSLPESTYQTKGGATIWIDTDWSVLNKNYNVAIANRNNFAMVIDPTSLENFIDLFYSWELIYRINNQDYHAAGEKGVVDIGSKDHHYFKPFRVKTCNNYNYCTSILSDSLSYLSRNPAVSILIIVLGYLSGWLSYVYIRRYISHLYSIEYRVQRGLANSNFYPVVQPIIDLTTQKIVSCEVLARFEDKAGPLYPDAFIPIIAKQDVSWPFTVLIIEATLASLKKHGLEDEISIAFNVMPRDVTNGNILTLLDLESVAQWRGELTIELTESEELEETQAHKNLSQLKQYGINISIDDFGTGYSNLKYIDQLHCRYLKIDRTFIMDVEEGSIRSSIIPNIVSIAEKSNLRVIAEGVENLAQSTELKRMGIRYVQGYYFGKPMSIANLAQKLKQTTDQ
ncbi:EAL domain-containing protein [Gilvimarinus agarilyticus]|uniref:EAL domain-containing protein n=1 Tax=unclassified Gilvimarinus TaxID=2642066 RepID=UPI001C093B6A|nr:MULTISPECIES: EAL domain-containing protein [unclassified Gilvimarinus]MBU2886237.1 EAL domain-containing protein [Gilvimarinus agarilyticus]MDO6570925.1 EAL domain-containing protein [Gilvimarinus sp. 2_MG-2023]MDO6747788.1 EAL domain-containing protein [Gilvimarinus sp. 1_MG-2023]